MRNTSCLAGLCKGRQKDVNKSDNGFKICSYLPTKIAESSHKGLRILFESKIYIVRFMSMT